MAAMGSPFGLSLPMPFTQSFKRNRPPAHARRAQAALLLIAFAGLAGCESGPKVPDWNVNAIGHVDRFLRGLAQGRPARGQARVRLGPRRNRPHRPPGTGRPHRASTAAPLRSPAWISSPAPASSLCAKTPATPNAPTPPTWPASPSVPAQAALLPEQHRATATGPGYFAPRHRPVRPPHRRHASCCTAPRPARPWSSRPSKPPPPGLAPPSAGLAGRPGAAGRGAGRCPGGSAHQEEDGFGGRKVTRAPTSWHPAQDDGVASCSPSPHGPHHRKGSSLRDRCCPCLRARSPAHRIGPERAAIRKPAGASWGRDWQPYIQSAW